MDRSFEFVVVFDFAGRKAKGHGYYVDFPFLDGVVNCLLPYQHMNTFLCKG